MSTDTFDPSDFRNPTDTLLNMLERSQQMYVEALKLGGWPIDVIIAAYTCGANTESEQYEACIARANELGGDQKTRASLENYVKWTWVTVGWNIKANLGPRVSDKTPQHMEQLFHAALEQLLKEEESECQDSTK